MKKIFLMAAAAVAVIFTSCSKENVSVPQPGGNEINTPTYASFKFNLGSTNTRATSYDPSAETESTADEKIIGTGDLYILVFNAATQNLEYKSAVTATNHTALLTAGQKKIFVLANIGAAGASANVQGNLKTVDPATLAASSAEATYADLVVGTTSLSDFYKIAFDAGQPQAYDVVQTPGTRSFSVAPLHTLINAGTLGLPMSNNNAAVFTLAPNVTQEEAENAANGAPVTSGAQTKNRFKVELDFLGAKARMVANLGAMTQTDADITAPKYTIKNLAKYTSLVQNVVAGVNQSIYHNMTFGANPTQNIFQAHVDQASNAVVPVAAAAAAATPYIYVPENTNLNLLRGQSSFFALNVTYKPRNIVEKMTFDPLSETVKFTFAAYDASTSVQGNSYVYATEALHGMDPNIKFFGSARDFADAVWMTKNKKPISDGSYSEADADVLVVGKFKTYHNAQSWYRMDIGKGSGSNTVYGVLRGNAYTATVNNITGPGEPTEGDLFEKPEEPVVARTYINVTIEAKGWNPVEQGGDL